MGVGDLRNLRGCGSVGCNFIALLLDISYTVLGVILDLGCYSIDLLPIYIWDAIR